MKVGHYIVHSIMVNKEDSTPFTAFNSFISNFVNGTIKRFYTTTGINMMENTEICEWVIKDENAIAC